MPMAKEHKKSVMEEFRVHESDTGSPEVQVALLTNRINQVQEHLKVYKKDFHSRRGMLMMIGRRQRLLTYLGRVEIDRYRSLIGKLGLRDKIIGRR